MPDKASTGPQMAHIAEFTKGLSAMKRTATAYVCRDLHCELPSTETLRMVELSKTKQRLKGQRLHNTQDE
jgi:hypothetical protein